MNAQAKTDTTAKPQDLYYAVHKGIRLANCRMLAMLGQTDPSDNESVETALAALSAHLEMSLSHLTHENEAIHSAIEARLPGGSHAVADDHEDHLRAFSELRRLAEELASGVNDRPARLRKLYQRFALFVAEDLQHMHEEETEVMPMIAANFSADEIAAIEHRIVSNIPPAEMLGFMRYMLGATSKSERIEMLTGMQAGMPAEVFAGFTAALAGPDWQMGDWEGLDRALR